jgi:hypothetical protein
MFRALGRRITMCSEASAYAMATELSAGRAGSEAACTSGRAAFSAAGTSSALPNRAPSSVPSLCQQLGSLSLRGPAGASTSAATGLSGAQLLASRGIHVSPTSQFLMKTTGRRGRALYRFMLNMFPRKIFPKKNRFIRNVVRSEFNVSAIDENH